jgi:hypothetical protein
MTAEKDNQEVDMRTHWCRSSALPGCLGEAERYLTADAGILQTYLGMWAPVGPWNLVATDHEWQAWSGP